MDPEKPVVRRAVILSSNATDTPRGIWYRRSYTRLAMICICRDPPPPAKSASARGRVFVHPEGCKGGGRRRSCFVSFMPNNSHRTPDCTHGKQTAGSPSTDATAGGPIAQLGFSGCQSPWRRCCTIYGCVCLSCGLGRSPTWEKGYQAGLRGGKRSNGS